MAVRPGYKQTEVGVIPEDWEIYPLQDLTIKSAPITYGVLKPGDYVPNGIPLLQIKDVIYGDIKIDELHRIGTNLDEQYSRTKLTEGDIVISLIGTVGKVAHIPRALTGANLHRNLAKIRISPKNSSRFILFYLQSEQVKQAIKLATFGSTQALFNLSDLRSLLIAVPPLHEQQAIAEALSDVDGLISALDGLIAKKRALKQGAMQELLTGQRRLPGFVGESYKQTEVGVIPNDWEVVTIGDLNPFVTSGSRGWAEFYAERGSPFIRITNLLRESIYIDLQDLKFVSLPAVTAEAVRTQLQVHDVLISITADIGIIGYVSANIPQPAYINQHIALIRFDQTQTNSQFVSYFLASEGPQKLFKASTDIGAKAGMSLITVQKIRLALPPLAEQTAIAQILADMDAEIAALVQKREKTVALKQGMMQRLLTGAVRLV